MQGIEFPVSRRSSKGFGDRWSSFNDSQRSQAVSITDTVVLQKRISLLCYALDINARLIALSPMRVIRRVFTWRCQTIYEISWILINLYIAVMRAVNIVYDIWKYIKIHYTPKWFNRLHIRSSQARDYCYLGLWLDWNCTAMLKKLWPCPVQSKRTTYHESTAVVSCIQAMTQMNQSTVYCNCTKIRVSCELNYLHIHIVNEKAPLGMFAAGTARKNILCFKEDPIWLTMASKNSNCLISVRGWGFILIDLWLMHW